MYWLVNLVNGWLRICSVIERLISAGARSRTGVPSVEYYAGLLNEQDLRALAGYFQPSGLSVCIPAIAIQLRADNALLINQILWE
ncbi:hypothetical protein EUX58_09110 [Pseudomonas sp. 770NI]|uniref:hypothetical protein n=1 Tax=Pseudomonas sp. 770NI TaxID=2528664 RepID=UPI001022F4C1|nr:hypothetical protein [Pseudomonas sp. 770NI]RZI25593.1 hypothetical protein EUX58_09110 [Pseudomonas sp. 770NI]